MTVSSSPTRRGRAYSCSQLVPSTPVKPASVSTVIIECSGSSGSRFGCSPPIVHTWAIAGGASPACQRGSVSPIASTQLLIIGWLTGSRPGRGDVSPLALIRSAAAMISS